MTKKTVLVTGASDGVGRGVAQALAAQGHTLLLHGRDQGRVDAVAGSLRTDVRTYIADLASMRAVRTLTRQLLMTERRIDVVIANAGVGGDPRRQVTEDGLELTLAVNYLSQFVLINGLVHRLEESAPARVVLVTSSGQSPLDFCDPLLENGYDPMRAYTQSKLAQIAFGFDLAARLDPGKVTVASIHPATWMPTKIVKAAGGPIVDSLERGVASTVRVALDPDLEGVTGVFFDRERRGRPDPWAADRKVQRRLWRLSERLTR